MPGLLQRVRARREKRRARRRARLAEDYVGDAEKLAAEAQQRRVLAESASPPYAGGPGPGA
jgi:hypothetical protein